MDQESSMDNSTVLQTSQSKPTTITPITSPLSPTSTLLTSGVTGLPGNTTGLSTPLVEATRQRSLPLVELLLRHGARDEAGDAVACAAANQDGLIVARLLATKVIQ